MASYKKLYEARVPYDGGSYVQRFYDKLSVDLIMHNYIRTQVRAQKVSRKPLLYPLPRALKLPLTARVQGD